MDRRVTPPKKVTSPTWGPPCKQALKVPINADDVIAFCIYLMNKMQGTPIKIRIFTIFKLFNRFELTDYLVIFVSINVSVN